MESRGCFASGLTNSGDGDLGGEGDVGSEGREIGDLGGEGDINSEEGDLGGEGDVSSERGEREGDLNSRAVNGGEKQREVDGSLLTLALQLNFV